MRIANLMFARSGGGIEQAFVDYCIGLKNRGHQVIAFTYPGAWVERPLAEAGVPIESLRNVNEWDILASWRLCRRLQARGFDVAIAHGNRAYSLTRRAAQGKIPVVAVAQNYLTRRFTRADAVFTTTRDLIRHLVKQGVASERVFLIPNMIACHELPQRLPRRQPAVIGAMGRFVSKKGFADYIEALALLKSRGYRFRALLGGTGEEESRLKALASRLGLKEILQFPGWIADRKAFYSGLDIFCLPSLHEPFGIVLLEAFVHGAPVVTSDSEGPHDIVTPNYDALVVPKASPEKLAAALARLLDDPALADNLAANGFAKAKLRYSIEVVAEHIEAALAAILKRHPVH